MWTVEAHPDLFRWASVPHRGGLGKHLPLALQLAFFFASDSGSMLHVQEAHAGIQAEYPQNLSGQHFVGSPVRLSHLFVEPSRPGSCQEFEGVFPRFRHIRADAHASTQKLKAHEPCQACIMPGSPQHHHPRSIMSGCMRGDVSSLQPSQPMHHNQSMQTSNSCP